MTTTTPASRADAPATAKHPRERLLSLAFPLSSTDRPTDVALLLARLVVGAVFIGHGAGKLFGWWGGAGIEGTGVGFEKAGLSPGEPLALLAGAGEFFGGILVALGLLTRLGAFSIGTTMVVAIISMHLPGPFLDGYEFPLTLLAIAGVFLLAGPGRFSLDAVIRRRLSRAPAASQPAAGRERPAPTPRHPEPLSR